jgi:hypothetical protein
MFIDNVAMFVNMAVILNKYFAVLLHLQYTYYIGSQS